MNRRSGTGEIVDLVHFEEDRVHHVMPHDLEARVREMMRDIASRTCEEVVQADHLGALGDQAIAQVAAQEPGAAGYKDSFPSQIERTPNRNGNTRSRRCSRMRCSCTDDAAQTSGVHGSSSTSA